MDIFEVIFYGQKKPMIVKADAISGVVDGWITFYDRSNVADIKIVAMFSSSNVMCIVRKDKIDEQN